MNIGAGCCRAPSNARLRHESLEDASLSPQVHLLVFDGPPPALDDDVVSPGTLSVHTDLDFTAGQPLDEVGRGELVGLIGIDGLRPAVARRSILDGLGAEPGLRRDRYPKCQSTPSPRRFPPAFGAREWRRAGGVFLTRSKHLEREAGPAHRRARAAKACPTRRKRLVPAPATAPVEHGPPTPFHAQGRSAARGGHRHPTGHASPMPLPRAGCGRGRPPAPYPAAASSMRSALASNRVRA